MGEPASSWELSPLYRHASSTVFFPDASHLVSTHQNRLILRRTDTLDIQRTWTLPVPVPIVRPAPEKPLRERNSASTTRPTTTTHKPTIDAPLLTHLSISSTSSPLIFVYAPKVSTAWVLSPVSDEPVARLEIGSEGCASIGWSPDGCSVMIWSGNHIRLSVYRLSDPSKAHHINNPKLLPPYGLSHSPSHPTLFALAERHSFRDHISIYSSNPSPKLMRSFQLPSTTSDIADLEWSPCGRYLAVWEAPINDLVVHIYSSTGTLLKTFAPYSMATQDGKGDEMDPRRRLMERERRREERSTEGWVGLGVRSVKWHPQGEYLAIGGWDGKIRILSRLGWTPVAELLHPTKVSSSVAVFEEPSSWISRTLGHGIVPFELQSTPYNPPTVRPDLNRPNPQMGVKDLAWSKTGRWLVSYNQAFPNTLWIFSFHPSTTSEGELKTVRPTLDSIIVLKNTIGSFEWNSHVTNEGVEELVIVSGVKAFTTWRSPIGENAVATVEGVGVPARNVDFHPTSLRFSSTGRELLLSDRSMFVVAYPVSDPSDQGVSISIDRTFSEDL